MSLPNTPFLTHHSLTINTLSPVHIGCGEDYEPTNYVMDEQALFYFNLPAVVDCFSAEDVRELNAINNSREPLLRIQNFFKLRKDLLIDKAEHMRPVSQEAHEKYQKAAGKAVNVEQSGKKVSNALEIARTAFNPHNQQPILPGSSIKGAIRTALLDLINKGKKTSYQAKEERKLEADLFQGSFASDPMRLIKVADASFNHHENALLPRVLFETNVKRNINVAQKDSGQLSLMCEALPEFAAAAFAAQISVQDLQGKKSKKGQDNPSVCFSTTDIIQACNRFYWTIFRNELDRFKKRGCLNATWETHAYQLLELLKPFKEANAGMILRIGRHSGAESITLDGVRDIKIMQGKGNKPRYQASSTTDWLAGDKEKSEANLMPFGWVFVDFNEPELQSAREKLHQFLTDASQKRLQEQQQVFSGFAKRQQAAQAQRAALAEKQRQQEEARLAEEQAEQAKQQALAVMSEEERSIALIADRVASGQDKGVAGGVLASDLAKLCEQAASWSPELKQKLLPVTKTACAHLGIDIKGNKKWKPRIKGLEE